MKVNKIPDTLIVKEALKITKAALSKNIWNHSIRTFFFAQSYADKKQCIYSEEELILISLFHDIGFYSPYQIKGKSFQISSSLALKNYLLCQKNILPDRINAMMEAIDFHFQFQPRWDKGTIAGLLQIGTHMDVLGTRKEQIDKQTRIKILDEYPKKMFFLEFNCCVIKSIKGIKDIKSVFFPNMYFDNNHYIQLK